MASSIAAYGAVGIAVETIQHLRRAGLVECNDPAQCGIALFSKQQ